MFLKRLTTPGVSDPITRVSRDPIRKIAPNERIMGPAFQCESYGLENRYLLQGVAYALKFKNPEDEQANELQNYIAEKGVTAAILKYTGIKAGSRMANRPPIKGIENSIEATEYLSGKEVGDNVIIIGGGLTGCEIAYDLILKGKKPTIVEMKNDLIAVKGVCLANSSFLREMLAYKKAPVYLETTVKEIRPDGATVTDKNGKDFDLTGDSVIVSIGYHPTPLTPASKHVHLVGDADKVGNLRTVIWRAWDVCMKI